MKISGSIYRRALAPSPLAIAITGALAAAQAAGAQQLEVEEVVVTATRREQSVLDVPYNISAVSGDALEAGQITDQSDLMRNVTGVGVVDRGYRNSGVINGVMIRGVNSDGAALGDYALSAVPTVSTYVNDTPLYANFVIKDIERVEVLRGPQGTLYGSGSLGGTVRYVTRAPKLGEFDASVGVTGSQVDGSDSMGFSGDGMINLPLGETLALRVNGTVMDFPGVTDYVNVYALDDNGIPVAPNGVLDSEAQYSVKKDADTVDIKFGRAALRWTPSDAVDVTLSYARQSDDIGGRRQQTVGFDGYGREYRRYENGAVQLEPSSRDVELSSLEASIDFGFATLTSSTSYYDHEGDSVSENTGFYAQAGFLSFYYNYPRPMASAVRTYSDEAFVQELRLVSDTGKTLDYVVGLYYMDQKLGSTQQSLLRGFKRWWDEFSGFPEAVTGDMDFDYSRRETFEDRAAFGELTWHLSETAQITGGLRYYQNDFTNHTYMALPLYAGFAPPTNASFDSDDDGALFKINASWRFAGRHTLYGTISEGYRRGGSNAVPLAGTFAEDPAWQRYEPDSVVNYEMGVKGAGTVFQYSIAAYYVDWDDVQVNTSTPNWGFYAAQNGGKARSAGIEFDLSGSLTDRLSYTFGYAYTNAELRDDVARPDDPDVIIALAGARLPGTPENTLSASLEYAMPVGSAALWTTRLNGYYQSSSMNAISRSPVFNVELDSFQLWGASTTYSTEHWDATLFVKNLFNEEGVTGLFTEAYMGTAPELGYYGNGSKQFLSLPRTLGLTLNYRF
ncbi:MAG TPA: TonB-dependent receptor [Steroidobacter sp.]|uniref:TonB-dependent receptor n=1 Tax=Steroidobacter sp. TaxID=1978227 RepID=UPI002ED8A090